MHRKIIAPVVLLALLFGALFYAASGHNYRYQIDSDSLFAQPQPKGNAERRMVDMIADDSYLIDKGDSTIFILVGNFAAHHNGTVILADSAVRYSNQSFECFGNVLINQNDTYAYGERAEYNRDNSTATLYSELIKVVDGDAVMYAYNCIFNTAEDMGYFYDGCYVEKGESLLEAERGYYNTKTHDLIAVDRVEMRDDTYLMTGDSVIFNTATEDAQYFTNTNIWNDKDEYLFANEGIYTKARDRHYLTRDAYLLSPEREIWGDTIEYFRTDGHIIGRRNIQMDDTTQKVLGFADYGEWWDEPGNALFTRRPSMINYDPEQPDSLFLSADTLWLYTIAVPPPGSEQDSTAVADVVSSDSLSRSDNEAVSEMTTEMTTDAVAGLKKDVAEESVAEGVAESDDAMAAEVESETSEESVATSTTVATKSESVGDSGEQSIRTTAPARSTDTSQSTEAIMPSKGADSLQMPYKGVPAEQRRSRQGAVGSRDITQQVESGVEQPAKQSAEDSAEDSVVEAVETEEIEATTADAATTAEDDAEVVVVAADSLVDTLSTDSIVPLTAKQLRYRAKVEKRRVRDSVRSVERGVRDSLKAIKQAEKDSIQAIRDSILDIKIDSIIAKRKARSAQLADEEAARLAEVKRKADERYRRKIDKAKARALRRGKPYTGPEYVVDSTATDSLAVDSLSAGVRDTMLADSLAGDSLQMDSLMRDSIAEKPFPEDSVYKMIKAYRRVKMYRTDSQLVCDSLVLMNTDSIIRLYIEPVMWNEANQITADSMAIYTANELISKAHFMGDPIMGMEIDTTYYNQVKGKDMTAYFADGVVYRNDVEGNAQTIYYMQNEDSPEVTGLMYIESASITFYLLDGEIDKISYKQNPAYVLYPMDMIPETQELRLKDFEWHYDRRPLRDSVCDREIRPSRRDDASTRQKPRFRITERINYDRRRLVENGVWEDRLDELTPEIIEWRNTRTSYKSNR